MATLITKTIKPSGGDYTSLSSFNSLAAKNLVTADEQWDAECYVFSGGLNDNFAFSSSWTTDATRYLRAYTPSTERHNGTPHSGFYITATSDPGAALVRYGVPYMRIEGVEVDGNDVAATVDMSNAGNTCDVRFTHGLVHDSTTVGINFGSGQNKVKIGNTALWDCARAVYSTGGNANAYVYYCTAVDCGDYGFLRAVFKNCLSKGHSSGNYLEPQTGSNYNASGSGTATGGANDRVSQTFTFVGEASNDFRLASGDAGAKDFGVDLSGDSNFPLADDAIGTSRPQGSASDMGFFEVVSGGGGGSTDAFRLKPEALAFKPLSGVY